MKYNQCPHISIVIPAYNAAQSLYYILPRIPAFVSEVILVDQHSTDNTTSVARQLMPGIRIIQQRGWGKGAAIMSGLAACSGDIIILLNGDGSTDPQEIAQFVEVLVDGSDFVQGSRFLPGGSFRAQSLVHRLAHKAVSVFVNGLFGTRFSDPCYGYKAFWRYCLNYIEFDEKGSEVELQFCLRMHKACMDIVEVPSVEQAPTQSQCPQPRRYRSWHILKIILKERCTGIPWSPQAHSLISPYSSVEPAAYEIVSEPENERDFPLRRQKSS